MWILPRKPSHPLNPLNQLSTTLQEIMSKIQIPILVPERKNPSKFILKIEIKPFNESCKLEDQKTLFKCNDASHDKVREILRGVTELK